MRVKEKQNEKAGGILVMVVMVMLILSVMVAGMFKLRERAGLEGIYQKQSMAAFWIAEAGLQDASQRLNYLSTYRNNPTTITNSFGKGSYSVSVPSVVSDVSGAVIEKKYTIVSVGTVGNFNRRIQQEISVSPGIKHNIDNGGGVLDFNSNSEVDGSVIVRPGATVDTGNNTTVAILEYLYADPSVISGNGLYQQAEVPPGSEPILDHLKYSDQVDAVGSGSITALDETIKTAVILPVSTNLDHNVVFSKNVTIPSGATITSWGDLTFGTVTFLGPVTIETAGDITFNSKIDLPFGSRIIAKGTADISGSSTIGTGVEVIAGGNLEMGSQMTLGGDSIYYAGQDLTLASGGSSTADTSTGFGIAFLAGGDVAIRSNMKEFKGIIYAEGAIDLNAEINIYGTVIAKNGITVSSNVDFYRDYSIFDYDLAGVIGLNADDVLLKLGVWQELSPL